MAQKATRPIVQKYENKKNKTTSFQSQIQQGKYKKWFFRGCEEIFKFQLLLKTVIYLSKLTQILLSLANSYSSSWKEAWFSIFCGSYQR